MGGVVVCTSALLLVGCGGGGTPSSPATATTATSSGSASPGAVTTSPAEFLDDLAAAMDDAGSVTFRAEGDVFQGSGEVDFERGALRALLRTEESATRLVVVDGAAYVQDADASDAPWQRADPSTIDVDSLTPTDSVSAWRAGATALRRVGEETIDGDRVTRYVLTVDSAKALAERGKTLGPGVPATLDYAVWVDDASLLRRVSFTVGPLEQTAEYSAWGASVDIVAPPVG